MKLRHLKIFKYVCQDMNMTKAAKELYMSQPAVSQTIKELEEYYCTVLFERLSQKLYITDSGKDLLKYTDQILSLNDELEEIMKSKSKIRKLKIGATVTIGTYCLANWIWEFNKKHTDIEVISSIMNTNDIERKILDSTLDIALVEGKIHSREISVLPFMKDDLVIICNPAHKLNFRKNIKIKELDYEKFLIRENGSGSREMFLKEIENHNLHIKIMGEFNNNEAIKIGVKNNLGLGVVSKSSICKYDDISILEIDQINMTRNFSIVYHHNKMVTEKIQFFINHMDSISNY